MTQKTFPVNDQTLSEVLAFVEAELEALNCSMKVSMQIQVCVEELFINIVHYAYPGSEGTATLAVDAKNGSVIIWITDSGIPFDPLKKADPDTALSAEEREIGGLGIFMVKKTMDEVHYERKDNQNIFMMKKEL